MRKKFLILLAVALLAGSFALLKILIVDAVVSARRFSDKGFDYQKMRNSSQGTLPPFQAKSMLPDSVKVTVVPDKLSIVNVAYRYILYSLEVAYLENMAFKGKELKSNLSAMEMQLIAADYNEALKFDEEKGISRRKNLSLGYFEKGKLLGYTIGYVGFDKKKQKEILYVSDLGVLRKNGRAGGEILKALFANIRQTVKYHKEAFGVELPVVLEATTDAEGSYRLFMPTKGDTQDQIKKKQKRLKSQGLTIVDQRNADTGEKVAPNNLKGAKRVEFVMNVNTQMAPRCRRQSVRA